MGGATSVSTTQTTTVGTTSTSASTTTKTTTSTSTASTTTKATTTSSTTSTLPTTTISSTGQYVPITILNSQNIPTTAPFQEMLTIQSSTYSSYITPGWTNVEFTLGSPIGSGGMPLQAWVEKGATNTGQTVVWVNLPSGIAADGSVVVYMNFMSTPVLSSSGPTGEAPQLSPIFGQYDNGAKVFDVYSSFQGSSMPSGWTKKYVFDAYGMPYTPTFIGGNTAAAGGLQMMNTVGYDTSALLYNNAFTAQNVIAEFSWMYSGQADDMGLGIYGSSVSASGYGGDWPWATGGYYMPYEFYSGLLPAILDNGVTEASGTYGALPSSGTNFVFSNVTVTKSGISMKFATNTGAPYAYPVYSGLTSVVSWQAPISNLNSLLYIGSSTGGAAANMYLYWVRVRAYPPNGNMPAYGFGAVDGNPVTVSTTASTTSTTSATTSISQTTVATTTGTTTPSTTSSTTTLQQGQESIAWEDLGFYPVGAYHAQEFATLEALYNRPVYWDEIFTETDTSSDMATNLYDFFDPSFNTTEIYQNYGEPNPVNVIVSVPLGFGNCCSYQNYGAAAAYWVNATNATNTANYMILAKAIKTEYPNAVIRLAWEFDGTWFPWGSAAYYDPAGFDHAFNYVAKIFKTVSPGFQIALVGDAGASEYDNYWTGPASPGNDAGTPAYYNTNSLMGNVSIVGADTYDNQPWTGPLSGSSYTPAYPGLVWLANYAKQEDKTIGIGEWGEWSINATPIPSSGPLYDDPTYITNMYNWLNSLPASGPGALEFASYFYQPPNYLPNFPNANSTFSQLFGGQQPAPPFPAKLLASYSSIGPPYVIDSLSIGTPSTALTSPAGSGTASPTATSNFVPITLQNAQSATAANFQQKITVPSSAYSSYINSGWTNVEFTLNNPAASGGTPLQAWIESGASNTGQTVVWVNIPGGLPTGSTTIYMNFMSGSAVSQNGPTGEAPQLSPTYGEYDNGAKVFQFYDNFAGTSLSSQWTGSGSSTINNGATITLCSSSITSKTSFNPATNVADFYGYIGGSSGAYEGWIDSGDNTYTLTSQGFSSNVGPYQGAFYGAEVSQYSSQWGTSTVTEPATGGSESSSSIWNVWVSGSDLNLISAAASLNGGPITTATTQTGGLPGSAYLYVSTHLPYESPGSCSPIDLTWTRVRVIPPSSVMPSVTFGTVQ